jgi:ankyrin repeat protein
MKIRNIRTGEIIGMVMLGMHWAAGGDHMKEVELLIDKGADVNAKDEVGWTPLHYAADNGHKDVAELLIAKGADVNAKNDYDETPLHIAEHNDHKDLAELLKKHGARKKFSWPGSDTGKARDPADLEKSLKGGTCRQRNGTFGCIFCR